VVDLGANAARLAAFAARPSRRVLSHPIAGAPVDTVLRSLSYRPETASRFGSTSWTAMLARVALNDVERRTWQAIHTSPRRRREWLLGRVVAKDAVRSWLARSHGVVIGPRAISIATTPAGAPYVDHIVGFNEAPPPAVSLAHSSTTIVAASGPASIALGVDVESRDRSIHALARALDADELRFVESARLEVIDALAAKEAASKALGIGLGGSLRRWPIRGFRAGPVPGLLIDPPDGHRGQVTVEILMVGSNVVAVAKCDPHH